MTHVQVEKALEKALSEQYPHAGLDRSIRTASGGTVDMVLTLPEKRVAFEVKTSNFYDGLGRMILWAKEFDGAYLVIPTQMLPSREALARIPSEVGLISYQILDRTASFEIVRQSAGHGLLEPLFKAEVGPAPQVSRLVRTSLVSPKALRVVRYLIHHKSTTQTQIANDTRVSAGMVNKVVSALTQRELVSYRGKDLILFDVWKLLNEISWNRPLKSLKKGEIHVPDVKSTRELEARLAQLCKSDDIRYALTLFSGASRYIGYGMKYDSVQAYVERESALFEKLERHGPEAGEGKVLEIYEIDTWDIIEEAETIDRMVVCSPAQLIMDLVSYGHIGRDWAVKLYEATTSVSAKEAR
jgi:hypothetical protein